MRVYPKEFKDIKKYAEGLTKKDVPYPPEYVQIMGGIRTIRNKSMYFTREWEYPWAILHSNLEKDMNILDLGCGMQNFGLYLHSLGMNVTAQDNITIQPDYSLKKFKEFYSNTGVKFICEDISNIPVKNGHFDRIFCISLFDHITFKELKAGIPEIVRVLKKDGLLLLTMDRVMTGCRYPKFGEEYTKEQLELEKNFSTIYRDKLKQHPDLKFLSDFDVYKGLIIGEIYQRL